MAYEDYTPKLRSGELTPEEICPVVFTMGVIGQKWKIPILWHLADEGTLRYNELRRGIPPITNIMLTKCLRELEESGLVHREELGTIPPHVEYSLTQRGQSLVPILYRIHDWGQRVMEEESEAGLHASPQPLS